MAGTATRPFRGGGGAVWIFEATALPKLLQLLVNIARYEEGTWPLMPLIALLLLKGQSRYV